MVPEHALNVELLDDDRAVALGVGNRQLMQDVVALSPDLSVDATHEVQGFCSILGSFLPSISDVLSPTKFLQRLFEVGRVRDLISLRIGEQVGDAAIDGHYRNSPRTWIGDLTFAQDAGEPLISLPSDRAGLRLSLERSMDHDLQLPDLRETQLATGESPDLRVRLAQPECVSSLSFPPRLTSQLFEASLPRLVQLHEQLGTHVTRNCCEPRQLSSQSGQLIDLVESCDVLSLVTRTIKTDQSLLVGKVPQET